LARHGHQQGIDGVRGVLRGAKRRANLVQRDACSGVLHRCSALLHGVPVHDDA
jgi:hypothetical protein